MTKQENSLNNMNDIDVDARQPLSDKELASLIKASQQQSFNSVELNKKKEQSKDFKKVTLHDIAKQAKEVIENNEITMELEEKDESFIPNVKTKRIKAINNIFQ